MKHKRKKDNFISQSSAKSRRKEELQGGETETLHQEGFTRNPDLNISGFSDIGFKTGEIRRERLSISPILQIKKAPILSLMMMFIILWAVIFHYIPIYGITIAFKKFNPIAGFWSGKWVGFKYFVSFFEDPYCFRIIKNTVVLGFFSLVFGFPAPIIFALLLNEIKHLKYKKAIQTLSYLPHFVSTVVIVALIYQLFAWDGLFTNIFAWLTGVKKNLLMEPGAFRPIYISSGIWQGIGWGTIIYLAALSGINPELYEVADSDGATRFQKLVYVTVPALIPTITILFILSTSGIVSVGFEKAFLLQNAAIYKTADVIATYVFRRGIQGMQYSYAGAVGLINSVVSLFIVLTAHKIVQKVRGEGLW